MSKILFSIFLFCANAMAFAQNISNEGKEFWVGYGHHQFMEPGQSNTQEMILYLSAGAQPATVTVSINSTTWTRTYNVPANTVIASDLMPKTGTFDCRLYSVPPSFGGTGGEGIFNRGINIKSNVPIVAYAHTYGSASSGATMLLPLDTWGNVYYTINSRQTYANNCFSWAYCIAQEDNTVVEITPSVLTRTSQPAGVPFTVTLNKGQIYQVIGANPTGSSTALEMTGTKFKSIANSSGVCKPIAAFSGSSRTTNPIACGSGGGDNDNQQCFPTRSWGKQYLTAPTSQSGLASTFHTNSYKVMVKDVTTVVKRNGVILTGLVNNYYFFQSNTADIIEADKPIMVAQFMTGGGCLGAGLGDPEMMYISPIEQGIKKVAFYRNTREGISVNYLTLIIPTGGIPSLRIDGSASFDHTYAHPQKPGYSIVVKRWAAAQAQATAFSDSSFNAITYGLGSVESYGYNAGTFLNNLSLVGSIRNQSDSTAAVTQHDYTCKGSPVKLSALYSYKPNSLVWNINTLGSNISPNSNVTDASPIPVDTVFVNGIKYYKYALTGNYVFNDTGTFAIPIISTHPDIENCNFSEQLSYNIIVKATPIPTFSFQNTGCTSDTVRFAGAATTVNSYTNNQFLWVFPVTDSAKTQNAAKLFAPGSYNIKYRIVTDKGCVADSIFNVTVGNRPNATFTTNPLSLCENATVTFTDASGVGGTGPGFVYYWDFGNGTIINAPTNANQTTTYPNYGTYTIKHYVATSPTCKSDTLSQVVTVYAKPKASFTFPTDCLASNGTLSFTNTSTVADGQTLGYGWNFNDANANAGNPNTSTLQNPTHNYFDGTYNVNLLVTSQQGCMKDTTIAVPIKLKPVITFTAIPSICVNNVGTVNIANANVTNNIAGSGIYSGAGTTIAGVFNPTIAGVGTHTIKYIYTTTNGCVDSATQTIEVKAKPIVSYTYPLGGCLPPNGFAQFNGAAALADAQTVTTWAWNFNDANANAGNPNTSAVQNPSHNFTANGIYNVNLTATSSGGCTGDTTVALNFNIKPALAYPAISSVCINAIGTVNASTASVTNGVTGTGLYYGPGMNATGTFTPATAGVGTHTVWYKFTTPNGCADSISQTILVKAKPVVSYTYPLGGCLPPNGFAQFNGAAALADAQTITTWAWNFNDANTNAGNPNTSAVQNPSHNFTANGIYNVNLTATSSGGCTGDTTIALNFNIKPALAYAAISSVCINAIGTVNASTASVTNGVTGTGLYYGPGMNATGTFTPAQAGVGTHTVWYKFTTPNGCADSISQTILVKAKPVVSYTYPLGGCLPPNGFAQFNGAAALADAQTITTWAWNFNDANANAGNPNTSAVQNPSHNFTANGIYNVNLTATSSGGCTGDTTIALNFNIKPALAYAAISSVCINAIGTVNASTASVTNGVTGTGLYYGPGMNATGTFTPAQAGVGTHTVWYKFTTPNGCADSISQTILVKAKPVVSYTYPLGGCLPPNGFAQFNGAAALADAQTISTWAWNFNDANANAGNPNTSAVQNPSHNFTANGIYNVNLTATSSGGCTGDTTIALNFNIKPALAYAAISSVCINAIGTVNASTASVTNGVTGTGLYYGPGMNATGTFTPAQAGVGTHTVWYKFTTPNGCADSISQTILVKAKPVVSYTYPLGGCLPPNGFAQFNGAAALADAQTISTWAWNFNDANANAGNPNTSAVQNPSHNFTANGIYNVNLTATSSGGCTGDTTIALNFNIKPALAYAPITPVCQSATSTVSVANASVTNGATGTGIYIGANTTPAGQFNPAAAGAGTFTIWYKFTTPNGCVDSISQTILVQPKPTASFTKTNDCIGKQTTFTNTSTVGVGTISNWYWEFGDGTFANNNNGNLFTKIYTNTGTFVVKLVVTNSAGCVSDTAVQIVTIYEKPTPNFTLPTSVCMPGNAVAITNTSSIIGNGVLSSAWSFGDGNASNTTNPSHTYAAINNYNIKLIVTSNNGCVDSITKPFNAFFVKPIALFTANKDTLCRGINSSFTDLSTDAVGSAITNWAWSFGDGSTQTTQNPTKLFATANTYTVKLTVTNAAGCVSTEYSKPIVVAIQPFIDAGVSFTVPLGSQLFFGATANSTTGVNFSWSPATFLTNPNTLLPGHIATADRTFTLTATSTVGNCTATDFLTVKVLKPVKIPNAFSPNGDGINDTWVIENLVDYSNCSLQIYNRYGQQILKQTGYTKPWDGAIKGNPLPLATYYYVLDMKNGIGVVTGSVTIIK